MPIDICSSDPNAYTLAFSVCGSCVGMGGSAAFVIIVRHKTGLHTTQKPSLKPCKYVNPIISQM